MRDNFSDSCAFRGFSVAVRTWEQLNSIVDYISQNKEAPIARISVDSDLYLKDPRVQALGRETGLDSPGTEWILSLPAVLRGFDRAYLLDSLSSVQASELFSGVMTGSLEGLGFFLEQNYCGKLYADAGFYLWNSGAAALWENLLCGACLPLELRAKEQRELMQKTDLLWEKIVYGRIPMMVTANCVAQTSGQCRKRQPSRPETDVLLLRDRLGKDFPVLLNCRHCFNMIYNNVPLSLHKEIGKWADKAILRLQFTIESGAETAACLHFFLHDCDRTELQESRPPFSEYTTGHEKRGVQ